MTSYANSTEDSVSAKHRMNNVSRSLLVAGPAASNFWKATPVTMEMARASMKIDKVYLLAQAVSLFLTVASMALFFSQDSMADTSDLAIAVTTAVTMIVVSVCVSRFIATPNV